MDCAPEQFFFGGNDRTSVIGVVAGQKIQADDFNRQVSNIEEGYKRQQHGTVTDETREQIRQEVWDQDIPPIPPGKRL